MKSRWTVVLLVLFTLLPAAVASSNDGEVEGVGIALSTAKAAYSSGESILLRITVFNHTKDKFILHFRTSQRYDFIIETVDKKEVWRWSKEKMFLQVLGEERLRPGDALSYDEKISSGLEEGRYIITGEITSSPDPLSASIPLEVR